MELEAKSLFRAVHTHYTLFRRFRHTGVLCILFRLASLLQPARPVASKLHVYKPHLKVEHAYAGQSQSRAVSNMLGTEFVDVKIRSDMFGVERFVTACKI